jgi:hypothetical protein
MNTCSCGNKKAEEDGTQCSRCKALDVLGLELHATSAEIRAAYRAMSRFCQSEQSQQNETSKAAAATKLKDIETAYFQLYAVSSDDSRPATPTRKSGPTEYSVVAPAVHEVPVYASTPQQAAKNHVKSAFTLVKRLILLTIFLGLIGGVLGVGVLIYMRPDLMKPGVIQTELMKSDLGKAALEKLNKFLPPEETPAPEESTPVDRPAHTSQRLSRQPSVKSEPATVTLKPYITLGLTKDEVISALGLPASSSEEKWVYNGSVIDFSNGKVSGWKIDAATAPLSLRVKLWPTGAVSGDIDYITTGSTKNEVLRVEGTPTTLAGNTWGYSGAEVYFQNDRVVSWKNVPEAPPLHTMR